MRAKSSIDAFKIALIEPVGGHGGMHYYDFGLLEGLRSAGVSTTLYTSDETEIPSSHLDCTHLFFNSIYGASPKLIRLMHFVVGLLRSLVHARVNGANLAHYHLFHYTLLELMEIVITRLLGMQLMLTVHDVESFISGSSHRIARIVFKNADGIIAHNEVSRQAILDILPEASRKIMVIPHGNYVQYSSTTPGREAARLSLNIPLNSRIVLFFGQIKKVKGLDILLQAWKNIPHAVPNSLLLIAGKVWKDDIKMYQDLIEQSGVANSVRFDIRYIPDNEASLYYAAADLVVLPYRKIYQSGVLLMAMSHGRAVLVSDLPGMTEIIKNGENGFVFQSEEISALSDALIRVMQDTEKRESIARQGFQTVSLEHDWHKIGTATKKFYERICTNA
ncbi:MAG: glycosyltransferase family 4 protein [Geobacter sp.]